MQTELNGIARRCLRLAVALGMASTFLVARVEPLGAHDQGTLKLASKTFRAGDSLAVTGSKFSPKDEVTLILVGVAGRVALGDIPTDTAGGFRRVVFVPASTSAGQYRLIAEALDGDIVAGLDVVVLAAAGGASAGQMNAMPGMEGMPGHEGMSMDPTGEAVPLVRARTAAVTTSAVVLIIACFAAGAALLRQTHAIPQEEQV